MAKGDVVKEDGRSWVVAFCCCFTNLTFYGVSRLSGIMLVATTQTFNVSRASAAIPFSLGTAIRNLAGVFVGHLGHRFGVGPVVAVGCLLASLGSGLCFFAKDILWLSVCWGGIFGFGFGLCTCLLPLAINQNFSKHLGTASGISYSGSYIGSFIFPPAIVWLLETFAFQGTFLIIAGGILNVLIAALLLMEPRKGKKKRTTISPEDGLNTDLKNRQELATDQPYYIEVNEMWKRNINMAYMASQDGLLDESKQKQIFRHSISFESSHCCLQEPASKERSPENEKYAERITPSNNILRAENNINLFPKLPQTSDCKSPGNTENDKASACQNISRSVHFACDSPVTTDTGCLHSPMCSTDRLANNADSIHCSAKPICKTGRECSKKLTEDKLPFKANLEAKFKLKFQKLKKVLVASLLKHKSPYLKDFVQNENVRLTSFRNLQPILSPHDSNSFIPSKCLYLSLPQSILGMKSTNVYVNSSSLNSDVPLHASTRSRIRCNSLPVYGINEQHGILPVFTCLSSDNSKFLLLPDKCHDQRTNASCCDASANKYQNHSYVILPNDRTSDSFSYNIDTTSLSSICKSGCIHSSHNVLSLSPELFLKNNSDFKAQKRKDSISSESKSVSSKTCFLDWIHMFREPMFVLICLTMSIQTFILVSVITTIEDYARDVGISSNRTHYALMALSIANLVGTLTLGSITDRGCISRHRFMFICFLGMSASLVAVSLFAFSLPSLLSLVVIYGLLESGVIITFPLLTKQFVKGQRRQAVAIASSNVLSVPTVMLVPMLIGHFRDNIGSYTGLFQLLGATSLTCSLLWLVTPSIYERTKLKKKPLQLNSEKC